MKLDAGVTEETRRRLKEADKNLKTYIDFILMWDEIFLGMGLHYDETLDKIVSFVD